MLEARDRIEDRTRARDALGGAPVGRGRSAQGDRRRVSRVVIGGAAPAEQPPQQRPHERGRAARVDVALLGFAQPAVAAIALRRLVRARARGLGLANPDPSPSPSPTLAPTPSTPNPNRLRRSLPRVLLVGASLPLARRRRGGANERPWRRRRLRGGGARAELQLGLGRLAHRGARGVGRVGALVRVRVRVRVRVWSG